MPCHNGASFIRAETALVARPVLIAQISDLHITPPGALAYGRVDTAAALLRSIDTLNLLSPRPNLVVISGDIADSSRHRGYEQARALVRAIEIPFAVIPGNHDRRAPMRKVFPIRPMGRTRARAIRSAASTRSTFSSSTRRYRVRHTANSTQLHSPGSR